MAETMTTETKTEPTDRKKRGFPRALRIIWIIALAAAIAAAAAVLVYARYTKTHYSISFYQETSGKVSRNIRIAVISDLHNREYGENHETLLSDLRELKPDLVLFLGDMVIREEADYEPMLAFVRAAAEIAPCCGVLGNHESERIYSLGDRDLPKRFEEAGLTLLRNGMREMQIGDDTVQLVGIEGTAYGFEEYGGREFMENASVDPSEFCIVMAHIPILFDAQISDYAFDLGIAGHVHGGIIRLPFIGGLYSNEEGFFPKYTAGRYVLKNGQPLIISAGMGDSKNFPPRVNNMPELVVIDISPT